MPARADGRLSLSCIAFICGLYGSGLPVLAADKLVGGPFVVNVGPKSATVVWVLEAGAVSLGTEPGKADKTVPVLRAEKVTYTGLQPATTYYYDALGRDEGRGSFKTAPAGTADFQFLVYGDTRTRHDVHRRVMAAIMKHGVPDFALHSGDLVADGADSSLWPIFFDIERELLSKAAFFPALGNHERKNRPYYDFFDKTTPYYSFDWGQAHFAVLNSDIRIRRGERCGQSQLLERTSALAGGRAGQKPKRGVPLRDGAPSAHHRRRTAPGREPGDGGAGSTI